MSWNSDDVADVGGLGNMQKSVRVANAYKKGKDRREKILNDYTTSGGPREDGYGEMSPEEREAYKKGHRGD